MQKFKNYTYSSMELWYWNKLLANEILVNSSVLPPGENEKKKQKKWGVTAPNSLLYRSQYFSKK